MLLTRSLLLAYFSMTFFATATPIPTLPHLLPRFLSELPSDPVLTPETAVSLASLTPARQVRDASEAVPQIGIRNVPREAPTTTTIEKRMEDSSASESLKDPSGKEHKSGSMGFFNELFRKLGEYTHPKKGVTPNKKEFADTLKKVALHLRDIGAGNVIEEVAQFLIRNRLNYKTFVIGWPPVSASDHSPEQQTAVEAIQDWERQLQRWTVKGKLKEGQHFVAFPKAYLETMLPSLLAISDKSPEALKDMIFPLPLCILQMSIDDTQQLHEQLQKVAKGVDAWISTRKGQKTAFNPEGVIIERLGKLKTYNLVLNSGSTTTTSFVVT